MAGQLKNFCRNQSTVNKQIVEIMILSKIDNVKPEQQPIKDSAADSLQVSPAIGNTNVGSSFFVRERTITTITLSVALAIGGTEIFNQIERFSREATENEYTSFTHYNLFYSYPEWGKQWANGKYCEFHRVNTKCHLCDYVPERNYAGVGTMYLLNNGICNDDILVVKSWQKKRGVLIPIAERVPNTPRLSRMIILCQNHVGSYFKWCQNKVYKKVKPIQLELF
jgi:hypothetical protein